jgi:hypothetical protein
MAKIEDILIRMKNNPSDVRFSDLSKVCIYYFGQARQKDGNHHIYRTPWKGDPRINIQNHQGKAKAYQVKQVLLAIEKLEVENATEK